MFSKNVTSGYHLSLVLWSVALCLLTRAIYVYPLLTLVNRYLPNLTCAPTYPSLYLRGTVPTCAISPYILPTFSTLYLSMYLCTYVSLTPCCHVLRYRAKVAREKNQADANLISMNTIHM